MVRVRISFDEQIPVRTRRTWFEVSSGPYRTISDVSAAILNRCGLEPTLAVRLKLEGFELPLDQPVEVLRDGDLIVIKLKGKRKSAEGIVVPSKKRRVSEDSDNPVTARNNDSDASATLASAPVAASQPPAAPSAIFATDTPASAIPGRGRGRGRGMLMAAPTSGLPHVTLLPVPFLTPPPPPLPPPSPALPPLPPLAPTPAPSTVQAMPLQPIPQHIPLDPWANDDEGEAEAEEEEVEDGYREAHDDEAQEWQRADSHEQRLLDEEATWPCPLFAPRHHRQGSAGRGRGKGTSGSAAARGGRAVHDYERLPPLPAHSVLAEGQRLAFKLVTLDATWTPVVGGWREAVVLAVVLATESATTAETKCMLRLRLVAEGCSALEGGVEVGEGDEVVEHPLEALIDARLLGTTLGTGDAPLAALPVALPVAAPASMTRAEASPAARVAPLVEAPSTALVEAPSRALVEAPSTASSPAELTSAKQALLRRVSETYNAQYNAAASARNQVEYYFSDANLRRDGFLRERITADAGGWVALSLIVSFNRIARMGLSAEEVADALIASKELEVDRDALRVRRQRPLPA